jgi:protein required for attachment to host cells
MKDIIWALVMSATQARIITGIARGAVDDVPELVLHAEHKDLRDIMSDKPGRSFSSVGSGRSAMEYASDPVKNAKRAFVDAAVALLHKHFAKHDFTRLAIFAGPEMLGLLRDGLPPDLEHSVILEMPKDLLHETPHDLRRLVTDHVFAKE